jgi:hypothetical protein
MLSLTHNNMVAVRPKKRIKHPVSTMIPRGIRVRATVAIVLCLVHCSSVIIPLCDAVPEIAPYSKTAQRIATPLSGGQPPVPELWTKVLRSSRGGGDGDGSPTAVPSPAAAPDAAADAASNEPDEKEGISGPFQILDETTAYSGWRTITQRRVRLRNGRVATFDLVGVKTGGAAVLVFAWDTRTKSATLIREYMPASNRVMWGLAAGLVEEKHDQFDPQLAARHELEEECHLTKGRWMALCDAPSAMDKYSTTVMHCYLVLDPEREDNPRPLDDEEDIEIVSGVTIPQILQWIQNGEMNLVSGWGCLLAIEKLRELGEYQ